MLLYILFSTAVSNWFGSHAMGFAEFNKGNGFVRKKCFNHGGWSM